MWSRTTEASSTFCPMKTGPDSQMDSYDEDSRISDALEEYFDRYGIDHGTYDASYHLVWAMNRIPIPVPNPAVRAKALRRHDLNHVLSGYNAIATEGEIDIAGYEIGAEGGCGKYWVAWYINLVFLTLGLFLRRSALLASFARAEGSRNAYSVDDLDAFYRMTLREARRHLGVDRAAPIEIESRIRNRLRFWAVLGIGTTLASALTLLLLVYGSFVLVSGYVQ